MVEINLGDKVKCKITGFIGIAVAKTEYINGCIQYIVAPKVSKDNKFPEEISIDENSLEVIKKKITLKIKEEENGGSSTKGIQMRGF